MQSRAFLCKCSWLFLDSVASPILRSRKVTLIEGSQSLSIGGDEAVPEYQCGSFAKMFCNWAPFVVLLGSGIAKH